MKLPTENPQLTEQDKKDIEFAVEHNVSSIQFLTLTYREKEKHNYLCKNILSPVMQNL